jgi:hypothetical protein
VVVDGIEDFEAVGMTVLWEAGAETWK